MLVPTVDIDAFTIHALHYASVRQNVVLLIAVAPGHVARIPMHAVLVPEVPAVVGLVRAEAGAARPSFLVHVAELEQLLPVFLPHALLSLIAAVKAHPGGLLLQAEHLYGDDATPDVDLPESVQKVAERPASQLLLDVGIVRDLLLRYPAAPVHWQEGVEPSHGDATPVVRGLGAHAVPAPRPRVSGSPHVRHPGRLGSRDLASAQPRTQGLI
mmetsp:Transcript_68266/g.220788  ORF Transcript_68266/g.220788 Transcript_68266/m.220788 type:complete len:213 (+) Transcript_68266:410-1048(+)